jgi:hypothetical protein
LIAPARVRKEHAAWVAARSAVLKAAQDLIAAGEAPTAARIAELSGVSPTSAQHWRSQLVAMGQLTFERAKTGPKPGTGAALRRGLTGETPEELAEIEAAYRREFARLQRLELVAPSPLFRRRIARVGRYVGPPLPAGFWEGGAA